MDIKNAIVEAINNVEHPAIAASLVDLGMVRDVEYQPEDQGVTLTLALPVLNIPENVRDYMVNNLYLAVQSAGGELRGVNLAQMNDQERQAFLQMEQENWRQ